jgi:hypothetical protein
MVIWHFWISIVKDNKYWLLIFQNSARRGFLALGFNRKIILGPREENLDHPDLYDKAISIPL